MLTSSSRSARLRRVSALVGLLDERLGEPRSHVLLAARPRRGERVEREPADDGRQPRAEVADLGAVGAGEPQPRLLDEVLGLAEAAEVAVGDPQQVRTKAIELGRRALRR